MLKSTAVSRQGPRSRQTRSRPDSISSFKRIEPAQPRPITTASVRGSLVAISLALRFPVGTTGDAQRLQIDRLVVDFDIIPVIVACAGEAEHLPGSHVLVAAVDWISKKSFHRVLQHGGEKLLAGNALELDIALFQPLQDGILLVAGEPREWLFKAL